MQSIIELVQFSRNNIKVDHVFLTCPGQNTIYCGGEPDRDANNISVARSILYCMLYIFHEVQCTYLTISIYCNNLSCSSYN